MTEVEPLLIKANEALEQLTKRDIGEVKAYVHPPSQVEKVMRALMILSKTRKILGNQMRRVSSEGKEDTWEEAKKDLANVDFIKTLIVRRREKRTSSHCSMNHSLLEISER